MSYGFLWLEQKTPYHAWYAGPADDGLIQGRFKTQMHKHMQDFHQNWSEAQLYPW